MLQDSLPKLSEPHCLKIKFKSDKLSIAVLDYDRFPAVMLKDKKLPRRLRAENGLDTEFIKFLTSDGH